MEESEIRQIWIENSSSISEPVYAERIGPDVFKLLENPIFSCEINYGTTLKVESTENGELKMLAVLKASEFNTRRFLLSTYVKDSDFPEKIGQPVIEAGGTWEAAMGGMVFIHLPKGSDLDLNRLFKENNFNSTEIGDKSGA